MEAESQLPLNTLTEHDFQDAFKQNGRSFWKGAYARKESTSRVIVPVGPKLIAGQMEAPVWEIMDGSVCMCVYSFLRVG
jgi:hypothetical protein